MAESGGAPLALPDHVHLGAGAAPTTLPSVAARERFRAGPLRVAWRLAVWCFAGVVFAARVALDAVTGRGGARQRAVRLRETFELLGPTFRKVGQQLSVRVDLVDYEVATELSSLLDRAAPMPVDHARRAIERATGPIDRAFAQLDLDHPVGSASVACVYRGVRVDGRPVAVKVRRPDIGPAMAADLAILSFAMLVAEALGVLRDGLTRHLRTELRQMLLEELDFEREAMAMNLFRREARRARQRYIGVPRVHFDLSDQAVLVADFVQGVPMTEVLRAVDTGDEAALQRLAELDIEPRRVANRMLRAWQFSSLESLVFHADPHPANLFVEPGGRLWFVDFGSVGRVNTQTRARLRRQQEFLAQNDVSNMALMSLQMMEPLPPIDVAVVKSELEGILWDYVHALRTKSAPWWKKSSGLRWLEFAALARRHDIPANLDTLRIFRATFVYDTIAFRLSPTVDPTKAYLWFQKNHNRRHGRRRLRKALAALLPSAIVANQLGVQVDDARQQAAALGAMVATQHQFADQAGKIAYTLGVFVRTTAAFATIAATVGALLIAWRYATGATAESTVEEALLVANAVVTSPWVLGVATVMGLVALLKATRRLGDVDVD